MGKDCINCKHCIDKEVYTCEIKEPCINNFYFEEGDVNEH